MIKIVTKTITGITTFIAYKLSISPYKKCIYYCVPCEIPKIIMITNMIEMGIIIYITITLPFDIIRKIRGKNKNSKYDKIRSNKKQ